MRKFCDNSTNFIGFIGLWVKSIRNKLLSSLGNIHYFTMNSPKFAARVTGQFVTFFYIHKALEFIPRKTKLFSCHTSCYKMSNILVHFSLAWAHHLQVLMLSKINMTSLLPRFKFILKIPVTSLQSFFLEYPRP